MGSVNHSVRLDAEHPRRTPGVAYGVDAAPAKGGRPRNPGDTSHAASGLARKRSRRAALVLMAPLAGGVAFALSGCGGEAAVEAISFHDIPECTRFGADPDECQDAWNAAQAQHLRSAPRYVDRAECEANFGADACEPAPERHAGGSYFMPMMAGFLMGQMMTPRGLTPTAQGVPAGGTQATGTGPRASGTWLTPQPLYKSRDDRAHFRTAMNRVVGPPGPVQVRPSTVAPQGAQLVRRGGFGQQAAMRGPAQGVGRGVGG